MASQNRLLSINIQENHELYRQSARNDFFEYLKRLGKSLGKFLSILMRYSWGIVGIILLVLNSGKKCDKPLYNWLIASTVFFIIMSLYDAICRYSSEEYITENLIYIKYIYYGANMGNLVMFVFAGAFIFNTNTCKNDMEQIYYFAYVFFFVELIMLSSIIWVPTLVGVCLCCCICVNGTDYTEELITRSSLNPATEEEIKNLKIYAYRDGKAIIKEGAYQSYVLEEGKSSYNIDQTDTVCCICLEYYVNNIELRVLKCEHIFHKECLDKWFRCNKVCPLCRSDITV